MRNVLHTGRIALALVALVVLGACESGDPVGTPETAAAGTFEAFQASVLTTAAASGIDATALPAEVPLMRSGGSHDWVFVQGNAGDAAVEAVIGSRGGVLNLGPHWLLVPENAVRGDTRFRMTPVSDGTFHVDLTATQLRRRGDEVENDVGQAGFRKPVYLAFHFGDAAIDPAALAVAWLVEDGLVSQPTFIYEEAWAVGALRHFSGYVLVGN
jgi:hypothetical protein